MFLGVSQLFQGSLKEIPLVLGIVVGLYWLWGPVAQASWRNFQYRRYSYSGFWRGRVLDVYITDELIGQEETVNNRGDLVVVENRERYLNMEVGDETGFETLVQVPLKKQHEAIVRGDRVEMLVLSNRSDLGKIGETTDVYIPNNNIWVSDYPYLQRDAFIEVSRELRARFGKPNRERSRRREEYPENRGSEIVPRRRRRSEQPWE